MRKTMRPLLLSLFSFLCLTSVFSADLKTSKELYQKNSEEILQSFKPKFDGLQLPYQKALADLKVLAVKQGDLARTMAAIAELERFQKAKSLPSESDEAALPEIKALQAAYVKQYTKLELNMTAELGKRTVKYNQELAQLQKELTRAEKLDQAMAVMEEKERVQTILKGYEEQYKAMKEQLSNNAAHMVVSRASAPGKPDTKKDLYMVIDLSGGTKAFKYPVTYLADVPKGGWTDKYKTEKLVMRRIETGTFKMGSPENEQGRSNDESQHKVKLTQAFYIGVFEVTQRQWEQVTGKTAGAFKGLVLPVEMVNYNDIRGSSAGAGWPATNSVDEASFMGALRAKTGLVTFDLPTEAQWEYACRAGTDSPYAGDLDEMAWIKGNSGKTTHPVGQKRPNAWGLFDMHGNVFEWCLDWREEYSAGSTIDPKGEASGSARVIRGGSWYYDAQQCRSAHHFGNSGRRLANIGFRAANTLP